MVNASRAGQRTVVSAFGPAVLLFLLVFLTVAPAIAFAAEAEEENDNYTARAGSGEKFETTVERSVTGELSQEDYHQLTLLGSRVLLHLNKAAEHLVDEQSEKGKQEIQLAQKLSGVIHDLLPVTSVHTVVKDAEGTVIYEYSEQVQDERIPIYEATIMAEVVQPVIDVKKEEAAVQGVALQDASFLYTSALLDLGYVDRKMRRALSLIENNKTTEAAEQLLQAQLYGLHFEVNEEDSPLAKAQAALQLAERMVGQNRVEAAKANLQLARIYLESYKALVGEESTNEVEELRGKIADLRDTLDTGGMASEEARGESRGIIRGFWDTVTGWMSDKPGEAQPSETPETEEDAGESGETT